MIREVLRYPHPALKRTAAALDPGDLETMARVATDVVDTMRSSPGCVGLAAPQVAHEVRLVTVDLTGHRKGEGAQGLLVLVNPVVTSASGAEVAREGCLSIPDLTANVRRATQVSIEALGPEGRPVAVSSSGFEARCLLHEIDHLDGILFLDRVDSLRTDVFPRKQRGAARPT